MRTTRDSPSAHDETRDIERTKRWKLLEDAEKDAASTSATAMEKGYVIIEEVFSFIDFPRRTLGSSDRGLVVGEHIYW